MDNVMLKLARIATDFRGLCESKATNKIVRRSKPQHVYTDDGYEGSCS
jgi:hypothetical protein